MDNSFEYYVIAIFAAVITVFTLTGGDDPVIAPTPAVHAQVEHGSSKNPHEIIVKSGQYENHYKLEEQIDEPFLIASILPQRNRSAILDGHSEFVTFTPKATKIFLKKYGNQRQCPASFLNRYAEHITLYASNPQIAEKLAHWKQKQTTDVYQWKVVNITGQCMGKRTKMVKDGEDVTKSTHVVTIGQKASRDCHRIHVSEIEHIDASLKDYVGGRL